MALGERANEWRSPMTVPARVSLVTLGVDDVARATDFYRRLGWEVSPVSGPQVTFLRTAGSLLALFGTADLAADAGLAPPEGEGFRGVSLAINVASPQEVDEALADVEAAGGRVLRPAGPADWGGYLGYFSDHDGHVWEVAHNPGFPLGEDGLPRLP